MTYALPEISSHEGAPEPADNRPPKPKRDRGAYRKARYAANREKEKAGHKAYRESHREEIRARDNARRKANQEKMRAEEKAYREAHPDEIRAYHKAHRKAHPERIRAQDKAYRAAHLENVLAKARARWEAYREAHPEKRAANGRNRRARKRNAPGSHTAAETKALFDRQGGRCAACFRGITAGEPSKGIVKAHLDHIVSLKAGGSNYIENCQFLCYRCNTSKGAKCPIEWAQERGRLL